jgi:hypothetical protein
MSGTKVISPKGVHQEDMVEMVYSLWKGHASILNYISTLGDQFSALCKLLSGGVDSAGGSLTMSVSGKASFPTSMTTTTGVTVTLV